MPIRVPQNRKPSSRTSLGGEKVIKLNTKSIFDTSNLKGTLTIFDSSNLKGTRKSILISNITENKKKRANLEISNLRTSIILLRSRDLVFGGMPDAESYLLHSGKNESTVNKKISFFL